MNHYAFSKKYRNGGGGGGRGGLGSGGGGKEGRDKIIVLLAEKLLN